ncbi:unnamed protein product, partial [Laminaria digitata]
CQTLTGETYEHCIAVGYSQTAISVVCGGDYAEDDHCGTFLELHMGQCAEDTNFPPGGRFLRSFTNATVHTTTSPLFHPPVRSRS